MKALVTGASGFLGGPLVARLRAAGIAVRAFARSGRGARCGADEIAEGDLADPSSFAAAVAGVEWVFHAGARVETSGTWEEFDATNVRATAGLIRCASSAGVRRFIHVSSLSVYDVPSDGAVVREDSPLEEASGQRGFYARSKLEADRVAQQAMRDGAPVTVVRPGLLYGPGRVPPLARRALAIGPLRVLLASRDYPLPLAYVDSVADALYLAAQCQAARGRVYTIVDEHPRQKDYARLYRQLSGQRWLAVYPPLTLVRAAAGIAERSAAAVGMAAPLSRHQVERTLRRATFVAERARQELGWQPRVSLAEGLRRAFAAQR